MLLVSETPPHNGSSLEFRLATGRGEARGRLPRAPGRMPSPDRDEVRAVLADGLFKLWKKLRRRIRRGLPGRRSPELDASIHDLRAAARRFHSVARALPSSARRRGLRKPVRLAEKILDWTGPLRDATVEREGLHAVRGRWSKAVQALSRDLGRRHEKGERKLARRLRRLKLKRAHRRMRRFSRKLRRKADVRAVASAMAARSFDEIREARRKVDPTDARSVHKLRIALKRFRYLLDEFEPLLPSERRSHTDSVRSLQRTMGDVRDNELLTTELAGAGRNAPAALPETADLLRTLQDRRARMMTSFLGAIDDILDYWGRIVDSFRGGMSRGKTG